MLTAKIKCTAKDLSALIDAIDEVRRGVSQGNLCGFDSNDDGQYRFDISGEEEPEHEEEST